jgi:VWFA-related protein
VLALTLGAAALAQPPPDSPPQYEEEIEVRVMDIDVVVTDRKGDPITDLTREDFELYENGKRVAIAYFSRIVGGSIEDVPEPAVEVVATQPPRAAVTWVIFVDQTNMVPKTRNEAMNQLQAFFRRAVTAGDRGAVALNDGSSFRIRQNVTDDLGLLTKTLEKMAKERMSVSPTKQRATALLAQMRRSEADMGVGASGERELARDETEYMAQTSGAEISTLIHEEASRTRAAIAAMSALLDSMAQLDGRLALVYVGAGFNSLPASELTEVWRARYAELGKHSSEPKPEEEQIPIERELARLNDKLSAIRLAVYVIHGSDRSGGPVSSEDPGMVSIPMETPTGIAGLTEAGYARDMAERTGGLYFKVGPGLAERLETARRDFDNYYSLGYKPEGNRGDTRRINVKVNVDGARVRHRSTVREGTRAEKAAGAVVASVVQPRPRAARNVPAAPVAPAVVSDANPLGVSVEVDAPTGGAKALTFSFSIQLETLTFIRYGNEHRARFVMHFALVGRDGAVYPMESREQTLTVEGAELPKSPDQMVLQSWHLDVSPLKVPQGVPVRQKGMRLVVTVEDRFSDTRSVVTVPLGREDHD